MPPFRRAHLDSDPRIFSLLLASCIAHVELARGVVDQAQLPVPRTPACGPSPASPPARRRACRETGVRIESGGSPRCPASARARAGRRAPTRRSRGEALDTGGEAQQSGGARFGAVRPSLSGGASSGVLGDQQIAQAQVSLARRSSSSLSVEVPCPAMTSESYPHSARLPGWRGDVAEALAFLIISLVVVALSRRRRGPFAPLPGRFVGSPCWPPAVTRPPENKLAPFPGLRAPGPR